MTKHTITVCLNGIDINSWHKFHLRCNPFPQIAKAEWDSGQRALAELDGDPIKDAEDIISRLKGKVSSELIGLCISQFRPGERTEFDFTFDDEE